MEIVDKKRFYEILDLNDYVVADFYADWCGPCKMLAPVIEEVSQEFPQIAFVKVNVDQNEDLAIEHGVSVIPTLLYFKKGSVITRVEGFKYIEGLREDFNHLIG